MRSAVGSRAALESCWNCGQQLAPGSARCLYCGVPQDARSAQLVVAPHGVVAPSAPAAVASSSRQSWGSPPVSVLGDQFAGGPAGVGARLAAVTIDAVLLAAVATVVALLTASIPLAVLAAAEVVVGLWVIQARTGAGPGTLLLRMRVSRADAPLSPGVGRAGLRSLVTAAGCLVFLIGAWAVEASAIWDRTPLRRSWGDRAAGTVVVGIPQRRRSTAVLAATRMVRPEGLSADGSAIPAPAQIGGAVAAAVDDAAPMSAPPLAAYVDAPLPLTPPAPVVAPPALAAPHDEADTDVAAAPRYRRGRSLDRQTDDAESADAASTRVDTGTGEALLLIFDTGQREQLSVPVSANLGRSPAASQPTDALVVVHDPDQSVSKTHARLEQGRNGLWITDDGSTNGTQLIDESGHVTALAPGIRTPIEDGVRVRIGNRVFTVSRLEAQSA